MDTINAPSVFGWAADQGGCGYYRIGLPLQELRGIGLQAEASTAMPEVVMSKADVIIGQRVCIPSASATWQKLCAAGKNMVFEIDDDLWSVHPSNKIAYDFFNRDGNAERLAANCAAAKMVTVSTEELGEVVRKFNPNVKVIPNYINENLLTHERPRNDKLTIGWAGSATHSMDFGIAAGQLKTFFGRNKDVQMHFIGVNYSDMIGTEAIFTDWSQEVETFQKGIDFDIGIAPLKNGTFNKSKSYIKALEYAALGIPIVASDAGPYRDFVQHGVTGYLVGKNDSWVKYLTMLTNDEAMREEMGANGRKQAAAYTIQDNFIQWLQAFVEVSR